MRKNENLKKVKLMDDMIYFSCKTVKKINEPIMLIIYGLKGLIKFPELKEIENLVHGF